MNGLSHFSEAGRVHMVDISGKPDTTGVAIANGILRMQATTLVRIRTVSIAKGDVLTMADADAVMA